jgi:hypothetical protein
VTQTSSKFFHHVRREIRVLLNKKMEPPLINWRQSAGGLRHSVGSTRTVIDQRHLADQRACPCGLDQIITKPDVYFPFQYLPGKGNLRARVATRQYLDEKGPQDS